MARDDIDIRIRLQQARQFKKDTDTAAKGIKKLGTESDKAGAKAKRSAVGFNMFRRNASLTSRVTGHLSSQLKRAAGLAVGAAAGIATIGAAKSAVDTTVTLAKGTLFLNRATGLSIKQSSELAAVAKTRNIDQKALNMSLGTLSRRYNDATKKGGPILKQFKALGITQKDLKSTGGDFSQILTMVADGFGRVKGGPERTAAGMQLMGRGWQTLLPLFNDGSKTMRAQMKLAEKYGATFGNTTAEKMRHLIAAQREAKFATLGLQVAFGTAIAPTLTKVINKFSQLVLQFREGRGEGGRLRKRLSEIWKQLKPIAKAFLEAGKATAGFFKEHPGAIKLVVILLLLGKAFVTVGRAAIFLRSMMIALGASEMVALWPIALIVVALVALGAGLLLAYRKVKWFHNAVDATFSFVKAHWRMLIIPIAPVAAAIIFLVGKWRWFRNAAVNTFKWVKNAANNFVSFFKGIPRKIASASTGMFNGVKDAFKSAINWVIRAWNSLHFRIPGFDPPGPGPKFGGFNLGVPHIPELAQGGNILRGGQAVVGDRGRELLDLPAGAVVRPLTTEQRVTPLPGLRAALAGGGATTIRVPVFIGRRQVAEAVAEHQADRVARR